MISKVLQNQEDHSRIKDKNQKYMRGQPPAQLPATIPGGKFYIELRMNQIQPSQLVKFSSS